MAKVRITQESYSDLCLGMAEQIKEYNPDCLVAVMRGGMTATHLIAKHLALEVGVCFPNVEGVEVNLVLPNGITPKRLVFIEDLAALGRTANKITDYLEKQQFEYMIAPVFVDDKCPMHFDIYGIRSKHWLVAPFEEAQRMEEGNQGLFRESEAGYAR